MPGEPYALAIAANTERGHNVVLLREIGVKKPWMGQVVGVGATSVVQYGDQLATAYAGPRGQGGYIKLFPSRRGLYVDKEHPTPYEVLDIATDGNQLACQTYDRSLGKQTKMSKTVVFDLDEDEPRVLRSVEFRNGDPLDKQPVTLTYFESFNKPGRLYLGLNDGSILEMDPGGLEQERFFDWSDPARLSFAKSEIRPWKLRSWNNSCLFAARGSRGYHNPVLAITNNDVTGVVPASSVKDSPANLSSADCLAVGWHPRWDGGTYRHFNYAVYIGCVDQPVLAFTERVDSPVCALGEFSVGSFSAISLEPLDVTAKVENEPFPVTGTNDMTFIDERMFMKLVRNMRVRRLDGGSVLRRLWYWANNPDS